ncbi:unnamed protein product [Ambrosiozyma monospora]|uniref:Unnamed protein product n=1 Tax=Ambrosiozyma monospora TaxID=43982 RepID=A0ACB5T1B8_AMBMO|nr:unnamed protein product [Ambrosiozyma monospora]
MTEPRSPDKDPHKSPDEPPKKRKYSKAGCKECKRRKIKCDEAKPLCWHCKRLGKVCIYLPPKPRKKRIASSNPSNASNPSNPSNESNSSNSSNTPDVTLNKPVSTITTNNGTQHTPQQPPNGQYMGFTTPLTQPADGLRHPSLVSYSNLPPPLYSNFHEPKSAFQTKNQPYPPEGPIKLPELLQSSARVSSSSSLPSIQNNSTAITPSSQAHTPSGQLPAFSFNPLSTALTPTGIHSNGASISHVPLDLDLELSTTSIPNFDAITTANILAHNLNDILNDKIEETKGAHLNETAISPMLEMFEHFDYANSLHSNSVEER